MFDSEEHLRSSLYNDDPSVRIGDRKPHLPVLIIPGFMSSGLFVEESQLKPSWEGKRIWINLGSLGINIGNGGGAYYQKKTKEQKDKDLEAQRQYKSMWVEHMTLQDDMQTECEGVKVRNIGGLTGVNYLSPGALTSFLTYVFGPLIQALKRSGYAEGVNLDAAPYDWRLSPSVNEERDSYFTRTMQQIEQLYESSGNLPVCLVCHSMGCLAGHYLLKFANATEGQAWIDKHVHTFIPVGAPHLGAPATLRSLISSSKLGLEAFLSKEEAFVFGRSLGSATWLLPRSLPPKAPVNAYLRKQGCLTIELGSDGIDLSQVLEGRLERHLQSETKSRVKLSVTFGTTTLSTNFISLSKPFILQTDDKFVFATQPDIPRSERNPDINALIISVQEPGFSTNYAEDEAEEQCLSCGEGRCWMTMVKFAVCFCLWRPWCIFIFYLTRFLAVGAIEISNALSKATGGCSNMAQSQPFNLPSGIERETSQEMKVYLSHNFDQFRAWMTTRTMTCTIKVSWKAWHEDDLLERMEEARLPQQQTKVSKVHETVPPPPLRVVNRRGAKYVPVSGNDIMHAEGLDGIMNNMSTPMLDHDPLGPRLASAPLGVKRVKAIYGVNVPTEVGAVFRLRNHVESKTNRIKNRYAIDKTAKLSGVSVAQGYHMDGGIIKETKDVRYEIESVHQERGQREVRKVCGDGTVPYWSMQHVRTWESQCESITVEELDGAPHREILADERFHAIILDYVCRKDVSLTEPEETEGAGSRKGAKEN